MKIFVSYSSKDNKVASAFNNKLIDAGFSTFYAPLNIKISEEWAKRITTELNSFDYFIVFISENSLTSDMVAGEVRKACKRYQSKKKKIGIIPIRINLDFNISINYEVDSYLAPFQQRLWQNEMDTDKISKEIIDLILSKQTNIENVKSNFQHNLDIPTGSTAQPKPNASIIFSGGKVDLNCPYYVVRKEEKDNIRSVLEKGALIKIFAPRQFGKSSLLFRMLKIAKDNEHEVIVIDLQQSFTKEELSDLDTFLQTLIHLCMRSLGYKFRDYKNDFMDIWNEPLASLVKFQDFFETVILKRSQLNNIVLALDEADRLFKYQEVSNDFFGMLRAWNQKLKDDEKLNGIKIIVSHSTEGQLATRDINGSPFDNVGTAIHLMDFNFDEIKELAQSYELSIQDFEINKIIDLIGGHPYLIRRSFHYLYNGMPISDLVNLNYIENGPFVDHLKRVFLILMEWPEVLECFRSVIKRGICNNFVMSHKLKAAGLIAGSFPDGMKAKLNLYQNYFNNKI